MLPLSAMATWAIGDVQGCMTTLEALLDKIELTPGRDRLWMVGDLVNRGPRSLDVLRWARDHDDALVCVLGNHDLHLLQRVAGTAPAKKRDTLDEILAAPDRDALIDWLRRRPMVHVEGEYVLCHAGLHPAWSAKRARKLGREIEEGLAGADWRQWIAQVGAGDKKAPVRWHDGLDGADRIRAILAFLTRVRCLDSDGVPDPFDEHPRDAPRGLRPWFDQPELAWADHIALFGHWAAFGLTIGVRHVGLDSGCVWGRHLTAFRLEDSYVVQVAAREH
jgi:bis(5'-nucleosyl)-tetraphosphatase (symmetrical)